MIADVEANKKKLIPVVTKLLLQEENSAFYLFFYDNRISDCLKLEVILL